MPLYWSCIQKFKVPSRLEPRPASTADVAPDLPANKAPETRHVRIWERRRAAATKGATAGAGALHHTNTHTGRHTRADNTHARLLHSRPFYRLSCIHGAFGAFICRDGCVDVQAVSSGCDRHGGLAQVGKCEVGQVESHELTAQRLLQLLDGFACVLLRPELCRPVESESRVTCTNEQQMRQPARILAPICWNRNIGVRVPRREHNIACGAGSRRERRRHEKCRLRACSHSPRKADPRRQRPPDLWTCSGSAKVGTVKRRQRSLRVLIS